MDDLEREQLQSEIAAAREQARQSAQALEAIQLEAAVRLEQANLVHEIIEASHD